MSNQSNTTVERSQAILARHSTDPLGIGPQMAVHEAAITRLWSIKLANQRAARRNEDRLDAEIAAHEQALSRLRDARRWQHEADVMMNRRNT